MDTRAADADSGDVIGCAADRNMNKTRTAHFEALFVDYRTGFIRRNPPVAQQIRSHDYKPVSDGNGFNG